MFSLTSYGPNEVTFTENFDIAISELLRSACDSIFQKYSNRIKKKQISGMNNEDFKGVTRSYLNTNFGYDFFNYENKNDQFKYFETFTFPKD